MGSSGHIPVLPPISWGSNETPTLIRRISLSDDIRVPIQFSEYRGSLSNGLLHIQMSFLHYPWPAMQHRSAGGAVPPYPPPARNILFRRIHRPTAVATVSMQNDNRASVAVLCNQPPHIALTVTMEYPRSSLSLSLKWDIEEH